MSVRRMFAAVRYCCRCRFLLMQSHFLVIDNAFIQLNHRKGLHRQLSDAELIAVLEYFRKAGVLFVSQKDILARLDADMGAQLDNLIPILVQVESIEGRYIDNQFKDRDDVIQKVAMHTFSFVALRFNNIVFRHSMTEFCYIKVRRLCLTTESSSKNYQIC